MGANVRLRGLRWAVVATAGVLLAGAGGNAAAVSVPPAAPPGQPAEGPGSNGPCAMVERALSGTARAVYVYEPAGSATATVSGQPCDDASVPAVFIGHGFGSTDPNGYRELIEHLVSVGNVVVYPTYDVADSDSDGDVDRHELQESYQMADAGIVAAVAATPRIDTARVGWWGHSHGGGMIPWLVQQGHDRGWGSTALWMSNVAQAYTQLVGEGTIAVPVHVQAMTVAFEHDEMADNRLGIDVFESLTLPPAQKRHVTVHTDGHGQPAFVANHGAPSASEGQADAVDFLLWRYADLLETCALTGSGCDADLSVAGTWSDGTPVINALVSPHPVDSGPTPAVLAECDAVFASGLAPPLDLNPRKDRCGPTHI